jgi:hypothetical protein
MREGISELGQAGRKADWNMSQDVIHGANDATVDGFSLVVVHSGMTEKVDTTFSVKFTGLKTLTGTYLVPMRGH